MMKTSAESNHRHLPGLDTLRAIAILMVMPSHAREYLHWSSLKILGKHGGTGVDLFFVLSGFLIGSQLIKSLTLSGGRVDFKTFYLKRSLRILPCYLVVLFLYAVWPAFSEAAQMDPLWKFVTFTMNFAAKRGTWSFSHAWSLCIEEHFYLVFPAAVALCSTQRKNWLPALLILLVLVGGMGLRFYLWSIDAAFYPYVYRPTYSHLDGLTVGVALALLKEHRPVIWSHFVKHPWLLFFAGIGLVAGGERTLEIGGYVNYVFTFSLIALGFGCLVAAAQSPNFWLARWRIPGASNIAALAFTLYLTHKQMIHLAAELMVQPDSSPWTTVILATTLVFGAAALLHHLIEIPCLKFRDQFLHKGDIGNVTAAMQNHLLK